MVSCSLALLVVPFITVGAPSEVTTAREVGPSSELLSDEVGGPAKELAPSDAGARSTEPAPDNVSEPTPDDADVPAGEPAPDDADVPAAEPAPDDATATATEPAPDDADVPTIEPAPNDAEPAAEPAPDDAIIPSSEPTPPDASTRDPNPAPANEAAPRAAGDRCPCAPEDAQCRKANLFECSPNASATTVAAGEPPRSESSRDDDPEAPWRRTGILVGASLGYAGCGGDLCAAYQGGVQGQLDAGYRWTWVAPIASVAGGGGPVDAGSTVRASQRMFDVGAGALLFPLRRGRVDPFVGARLGWSHSTTAVRSRSSSLRSTTSFNRGGARIAAGIGVFVRPGLSVGPRFDMTFAFGGRVCVDTPVMTADGQVAQGQGCASAGEFDAAVRQQFPRPWSLTLDVRMILPPGGRGEG